MIDKKDYPERIALKLREWDAEIDELRKKAERAGGEDRVRFRQMLAELREKREKGSTVLRDVHEACEDEWDEVRKSAEELLAQAGETLRRAA